MLQEDPGARLTMSDLIGHPWMNEPTATPQEFQQKYKSVIGDVKNYPEYSVDFDRKDAERALQRGDSLFTEETEPPVKFDHSFYEARVFKIFE